MLCNDIAAKAKGTRSAAKRRAADNHIEATAGTMSRRHVEDDHQYTHRPRAAMLPHKAKGTFVKKTGSWMGARLQVKVRGKLAKKTDSENDEALHLEEHPNETREGGNEEPLPCAFFINHICISAYYICCQPTAKPMTK